MKDGTMKMRLKNQSGASVVEFALVLPILVLLIFGIVEFSLLLYDKAMLTNASREGARAGIVQAPSRLTDGEITAIVKNYCENYLITFGADKNVTTSILRAGLNFGDDLTVNVTYNYGFLVLPNFITSLVNPINLSATTVMRME